MRKRCENQRVVQVKREQICNDVLNDVVWKVDHVVVLFFCCCSVVLFCVVDVTPNSSDSSSTKPGTMLDRSVELDGIVAETKLSDLRTFVSCNPYAVAQVDEFSELATRYQRQSLQLEALHRRLNTMPNGRIVSLNDLVVEYGICDQQRIRTSLKDPIRRAIQNFVSTLYATVERLSWRELTSSKTNRNGIVAHEIIQSCSAVLANACDKAVFQSSSALVDNVIAQASEELSDIWRRQCGIMIENERTALSAELEHIQRLAAIILQSTQMVTNKRDVESTYNSIRGQFIKVSHVFHRVTNDAWFASSKIKSFGLLLNTFNPSDAHKATFVDWVQTNGKLFHEALLKDCSNIERLVLEPMESVLWHGVQIMSEVEDTVDVAAVLAPSYLKTFSNDSGRVYIRNIRSSGDASSVPCRALPCVKVLTVLRTLMERSWLPIHWFSTSFVITVIHTESIVYSSKTLDIIEHLANICTQSGHHISSDDVTALVTKDAMHSVAHDLQTQSRDGEVNDCFMAQNDEDYKSRSSSSTSSTRAVVNPNVYPTSRASIPQQSTHFYYEYLQPPMAIDNNAFSTRLLHVHSFSMIDYASVCSIARFVWCKIDRSRLAGTSEELILPNSALVQMTIDLLQHDADVMPSFVHAAISNPASMSQQFALVVKKLIAAGKEGCDAADMSNARTRVLWDVSLCQFHGSLALRIGRGTRDPVATTLVDLCLRIKAHLDQSWPLPVSVVWGSSIPRRGKK